MEHAAKVGGMRILWLSSLDEGIAWNQNFFYERRAFGRVHDVLAWGPGFSHYDSRLSAQAVSARYGPFDYVLCSESYFYETHLIGLSDLECPKIGLLVDSYPKRIDIKKREWSSDGVSIVLHRYHTFISEWKESLPELRFIWQPWAAEPEIFNPRGRRSYDVAILGSKHVGLYPTRARLLSQLRKTDIRVLTAPHFPGVRFGYQIPQGRFVGEGYAKLLSSAEIGVATGGKPNFAVGKYFEIPACGTCLLGTWSEDLSQLGFETDRSMVILDEENPSESLRRLMQRSSKIEKVAEEGRRLVLSRHTWDHRVAVVTKELTS